MESQLPIPDQQKRVHSEKSEEVQAIIDRMPTRYSKYMALLIHLLKKTEKYSTI